MSEWVREDLHGEGKPDKCVYVYYYYSTRFYIPVLIISIILIVILIIIFCIVKRRVSRMLHYIINRWHKLQTCDHRNLRLESLQGSTIQLKKHKRWSVNFALYINCFGFIFKSVILLNLQKLWEEEIRPLVVFPWIYIAILIFPYINRQVSWSHSLLHAVLCLSHA